MLARVSARSASHAPDSADAQFDNVGFHSDFEDGFGACSYINYQVVHSFCDPLSLGCSRRQDDVEPGARVEHARGECLSAGRHDCAH